MGDDMTINMWYLSGSSLLAVPCLLITWALAWMNGKRRARWLAVALTIGVCVAVAGCAIEVVPQLPPEPGEHGHG